MDPRAKKVVFLAYPKGVKGYKLWLIQDKKVIINRDVMFNEFESIKATTLEAHKDNLRWKNLRNLG